MTDHIDEPEHVLEDDALKPFEYYYEQRLKANLRHVQPGDEIGARRARKASEKQAEEWEWLAMFNSALACEHWKDDMEHYRSFDPENPRPLDLQNLPFDPAAQFLIGCYAGLAENVRAWACENDK